MNRFRTNDFSNELEFRFSRSSGPGGQHVNKTESRVELLFNIGESKGLTDEQKETLSLRYKNRINSDGFLVLSCQESRSQLKNRQIVENRFYQMLEDALRRRKKRIPTAPSKKSKEKRLERKKKVSDKKQLRKKISF